MKNAEFRQLALLCELIDTQSLNEAAARLHMSASAASHALSRLRQELGDEICVRDRQHYQLTPYGEAVLEPFRQILAAWRASSSTAVLFDPRDCDARIALASCDGLGLASLAALLRAVQAEAPRLRLHVDSPSHGPRDIEALRSGHLDIACTLQDAPDDARDLHRDTLTRLVLDTVCLRQDHPLLASGFDGAAYTAASHLMIGCAPRAGAEDAGADGPVVVRSWVLAAELLATGDRLLTTTAAQARQLLAARPGLWALPLPPGIPVRELPLHMIWHQRTHQSKPHRWLRQRLRERAGAM